MPLAVTTRAHSERCAGEYGFPTRAGPALEPHAAGTKREGGGGARCAQTRTCTQASAGGTEQWPGTAAQASPSGDLNRL